MEGDMALLADKERPVLGTVLPAREATTWATLTGVVRIHTDADAAHQGCFVGEQAAQFRKGPAGRMPIGLALLLTRLSAVFAFGSVSYARQGFQTNETVGMGIQDVLGNGVIDAQLKPSLSRSDSDPSPGRRPRAFALEPFLDTGRVVGFGSHLLSRIEVCLIRGSGQGGQIPLAEIDAHQPPQRWLAWDQE